MIDAAAAAGVGLVAYTSLLHADTSPLDMGADHRETEAHLAASGIDHVLLRHGWYTENHVEAIPTALEHGAVLGCAGEGRFSTAARQDLGKAAAAVLAGDGHAGKIYELAGDESYTLADFAEVVAEASGKDVTYQDMPEPAFKALLQKFGLPEPLAALIADADAGAAKGALEDDGRQLSALIGRPTTSYRELVQAAVAEQ